MKTQIANLLGISEDELQVITPEIKKALREYTRGLDMPSYFTEDYIIFTDEATMKNWQYYAGFEYLGSPEILKKGETFICAYSIYNDTDDRIKDYLDIMNNTEN